MKLEMNGEGVLVSPFTPADSSSIQAKFQVACQRVAVAVEATRPIAVFGLFSGGHDSTCATAVAASHPAFTSAVHINTGIGVERTRQFVRETCAARSWPLKEYEAAKNVNAAGEPDPQIYREIVLKHGFPGPDAHRIIYAKLKERCLRMLERECNASLARRVMFVSGARSDESTRRMANTDELQINERRVWVAPIHDWTGSDTSDLMEYFGIARNPVVDLIHMSGECLCGAYARPGELAELALWPETRPAYDEIVALEKEVRAAGFPWGWEDAPPAWWLEKKRGQEFLLDYDSDTPQHLCWSCNKRRERLAP